MIETGVGDNWRKLAMGVPQSALKISHTSHLYRAGGTGRVRCWKVVFPEGGGGLARGRESRPQAPDSAQR